MSMRGDRKWPLPENVQRQPNAGTMSGRRLRRRPDIVAALGRSPATSESSCQVKVRRVNRLATRTILALRRSKW